MTYKRGFPTRLTKVDATTLNDHCHLTEQDACYFLGEYTARTGFRGGVTNDLIINLKKGVDRRGKPGWEYKERAIQQAATAFRDALPQPADFKAFTFVPIPPSSSRDDPGYDDRLVRMLQAIHPETPYDIRELIVQIESTEPSHKSEIRLKPDELLSIYKLDDSLKEPTPTNIFLVDDVLTKGAHFRASKNFLSSKFPGIPVFGLFVARRVPGTTEITD